MNWFMLGLVALYLGGSAEAVTAAAAIKCLGGEILAKMWPRDDEERAALGEQGYSNADYERVYASEDMAQGDGIIFAATGMSGAVSLRGYPAPLSFSWWAPAISGMSR